MVMKEMAAGVFKAKCLQVMDEVQARRIEIVITKRGKPVAKLVPASAAPRNVFGCMRGTAEIRGDITQPIDSDAWEASR